MKIRYFPTGHILFILISFFAIISQGADFILHQEKLMLFASNAQNLYHECKALQKYVEVYKLKNFKNFGSHSTDCNRGHFIDLTKETFDLPTYASKELLHNRLKTNSGYWIEISNWFPRSLWARYQNRPQDGVCYNTALVESGVLPEDMRSSFIRDVDFFIGLNGLVHLSQEQGQNPIRLYGPRSSSPAIKYRKTWKINFQNKEGLRQSLNEDIQNHFSPGSILCLSIDKSMNKEELEKTYSKENFSTNLASLHNSFMTESKGGHCLVFLTPNLISESNQWQPKNLMSWQSSFDFYFETLKNFKTEVHWHYLEIEPSTKAQQWVLNTINSNPILKSLIDLAIKHRKLYESLPWSPCDQLGSPQLYSKQCNKNNPEALTALTKFWQTEGALLDSSIFDNLKKKKLQSRDESEKVTWTMSSDDVTYSIYEQMQDLKNQLQ